MFKKILEKLTNSILIIIPTILFIVGITFFLIGTVELKNLTQGKEVLNIISKIKINGIIDKISLISCGSLLILSSLVFYGIIMNYNINCMKKKGICLNGNTKPKPKSKQNWIPKQQ